MGRIWGGNQKVEEKGKVMGKAEGKLIGSSSRFMSGKELESKRLENMFGEKQVKQRMDRLKEGEHCIGAREG